MTRVFSLVILDKFVDFKNMYFLSKQVLLHSNLLHNCNLHCHVEQLYKYCK